MTLCTNEQEQLSDRQNGSDGIDESCSKPNDGESNKNENGNEEEDEDEEEDVDFNPFLKGTHSPEASSSLSSEVEGLDGNMLKPTGEVQNFAVGDSEHGEEVVMQTAPESGKEWQKDCQGKSKKRKSDSGFQPENGNVGEKENGNTSNAMINVDNDDAICKRTRARYSLVSFTLDELETFLQETDDEDDLQNVDDEEEYRKFLAAVLQGGDGDGQSTQEIENIEDEDEDNDADFEIELEELLESDVEDVPRDKDRKVEYERAGRRPETRQNKRQKASAQYKKKLLEQTKRPLRPLLPILPNGAIASFPFVDGNAWTPETASGYPSSTVEGGLINGFTSQQIGQLHCLLYEHVQLLIQVFSLCILDPSRQHIASQVQGLILEMLCKRDEVTACRSLPYPDICFSSPSYMRPSVVDELPNFCPAQCTTESFPTQNTQISVAQNISASKGRREDIMNKQMGSSETAGFFWMPFINGPVVSILDVAPLNLVGRYMDDVCNAVREYRQRHVDFSIDTWYEREPLFHLPLFPSLAEVNGEVLRGNIPPAPNTVPSKAGEQQPKKTLAASIVERAKKQSIALVPKDISKLAQRFLPLFNPRLFPHKPPPAAVANRVLFTDAEDELLALGMMECNTDWKAIQQRFLPCKSKHQIFVRQKNRCSSKAPENPIKAVRRMKTAPLTVEEIERIQEGLKVFKLDWMSVWRFVVPHRDPSLLPRQWRIALGTQRSYKVDAAKREKRRIYESNRRKCKIADLANGQLGSDKEENHADSAGGEHNSGDDFADNASEAYVHQAFLSDWRPGASSFISSAHPCTNLREKVLPSGMLLRKDTYVREQPNDYRSGEAQPRTDNMQGFPYASQVYQHPHTMPHFTRARQCPSNAIQPNCQVSEIALNTSKSQIYLWPHRTRRTNAANLVRLAPELPPVNLPPSVRVISQSAFKSNQCGTSAKVSAAGGGTGDTGKENIICRHPDVPNLGTNLVKNKRDKTNQVMGDLGNSCPEGSINSLAEESAVVHDISVVEERGTDSDLRMHPLLFQAPEDGRLPYYPLSCCTGTSSSFSFFSGKQSQLNLSLFHRPRQANLVNCFNRSSKPKESISASCGIDFHPLLQRPDEENSDLVTAFSNTHHAQTENPFDAVQIKSPVNVGPSASGPKSSSPNEKANELDLEIHLSSTSRNKKTRGNRTVGANNQARLASSAPNSGDMMEADKSNSPCQQNGNNCPTDKGSPVSGAHASAVPSDNVGRCNLDDIGEHSHPEIVMEQEELSDSDEEIEEHVEFECEEMADSDGEEGSGCEPITDVQDKEVPSFAMEKATGDADYGDQQCEPRGRHPQGSTRKGSPFLNLSLTGLGKDTATGSWLSLDSCTPVNPASMKAKHEEGTISDGPSGKNLASCRPNRSCKKATPNTKRIATQKEVMDMAQQLSLGPLAVSTLRKPRKRACRANSNLSMVMTIENSRDNPDKFG